MTTAELNQFLNTPKTVVPGESKTNTLNYSAILFAGIAAIAIVYAVHMHFKNENLKSSIKRGM